MPRNYSHVKMLGKEIFAMKSAGRTNQEIAQHYGFDNVRVIKNLINRNNRNQTKLPSLDNVTHVFKRRISANTA